MHSTVVNAIEVAHLRRTFKSHIGVIRRTTRGIVAVRMLTTLLISTSGAASVKGLDVVARADEVRKRIGFIFGGEHGLCWRLSGIDNLRYFARLYGIDSDVTKKRNPYLPYIGRASARSGC